MFTNWGRIGTPGQFQQTPFFQEEDAVKEFSKIFKEKTKNEWKNHATFEKKYRKYNLVKLSTRSRVKEVLTPFDYSDPSIKKSELPLEFQKLMRALTDNKMYQLAYSTFNISQDYLPFVHFHFPVIEIQFIDQISQISQ